MEYCEFFEIFNTVMRDNGLERFCTEEHSRKFHLLTEHMLEVNRSMNLTAIKEPRAVILRHYADSLAVEPFLPQGATVIDIGCGAGFPSLPLAICRPDLAITAVDSTEKRIRYVQETAAMLELPTLRAIAMRAEEGAHDPTYRERFDVCTARAVAALPVLAELCIPYIRQGGRFIAMKAAKAGEELQAAGSGIRKLGGILQSTHIIPLKDNNELEERQLIEIEKIAPTPANLPRPYAKICKKPL